jgi:hypothetical protein
MRLSLWTFYFALMIVAAIGVSATQLVDFSVGFSDNSIDEKKLTAGSAKSTLITDNTSRVKFISSLNVQSINVSELNANRITASAISKSPTATVLTGSVAEARGSKVFGSGTAFLTELKAGDTVRWDGTPIRVATVVSDTEFVAEDPVSPYSATISRAKLHAIYFFDQRNEVNTSLVAKIPIPNKDIYPARSVHIFYFGTSPTAKPTLTYLFDGSNLTMDDIETTGNREGLTKVFLDPWLFPSDVEKPEIEVSLSSDIPARLAIFAAVYYGQGGLSGKTDYTSPQVSIQEIDSTSSLISVGVTASANVTFRKAPVFCSNFYSPFYFRAIDANDISFTYMTTMPTDTGFEFFGSRNHYCYLETTDGSSIDISENHVNFRNTLTPVFTRSR